jgi:hypothetical protein
MVIGLRVRGGCGAHACTGGARVRMHGGCAHRLVRGREREPRRSQRVLEIMHVHGECEARHMYSRAAGKECGKLVRVEGGAHQHDLDVCAARYQLFEHDQQEVFVHTALVDLVHDHVRHA